MSRLACRVMVTVACLAVFGMTAALTGAQTVEGSAFLKSSSKSFDDVVRAGVHLTSMSDFAAMNGIYAKDFSQPFPARTMIAATALPLGACVEIDLVVKA
jgi:2-iminobutanoate/2-iminopropanoate deaminase